MASNDSLKKMHNISIQPLKRARSAIKSAFVLSNDNFTQGEIYRKSTSDKTKQRIAHVAKFPLPVIKEWIPPTEKHKIQKQEKSKQKKNKKNLSKPNMEMKKIRNFIGTVPWAYSDMYFGRNDSDKRKSDDSARTTMKTKKQKSN